MADNRLPNLTLVDCRIFARNFSGAETQFNAKGNRNFCVIIDDVELAEQMMRDGWNVKQLKPRDDGEPGAYFINVKANYGKGRPPRVYEVIAGKRIELGEDDVHALDIEELERVDLTIRPFQWEVQDKSGVKGYLQTGYFYVREDALDALFRKENGEEDAGYGDEPLPEDHWDVPA